MMKRELGYENLQVFELLFIRENILLKRQVTWNLRESLAQFGISRETSYNNLLGGGMKSLFGLFLLFFTFCTFARADFIVLKNGKTLKTKGAYQVKGQYVVFTIENGQLTQIPVKIVDLEKSHAATEQEKQRIQKKLEALNSEPPPPVKDATMAQIAEYVENNRLPEDRVQRDVSLDEEKLNKFSENNPRPTSSEAQFTAPTTSELTAGNFHERRREFGDSYRRLKEELDNLDTQIASTERNVESAGQEAAFGDDPTNSTYEFMERLEKELERLKAERGNKQKELSLLEKNAKRAGVRDYKRYKSKNKDN